MRTKIIRINQRKIGKKKILQASKILQKGGLVAFPTETVYGLGANALDPNAVKKIFRAKGRPLDNPLIVHISNQSDAFFLAEVNPVAQKLMEKFWPGPLTLVMKSSGVVPKEVTAGLRTVAIRMPKNSIALALIRASGLAIAAPSANISGGPSSTDGKHVIDDFSGKIDCILDAGRVPIGLESTVLDVSGKIPVLLRPGKITIPEIEKAIGKISVHKTVFGKEVSQKEIAKSPGMKYRHYAPKAKVILVYPGANMQKALGFASGKRAVLASGKKNKGADFFKVGKTKEKFASEIFGLFRKLDAKGYDSIVVEGVDEKGLGLAIMNRLRKAAWKIVP